VLNLANLASFSEGEALAPHKLAIAIPEDQAGRSSPLIRDIIGKANRSVFGALVQNNDFELAWKLVQPSRQEGIKGFTEPDILGFSISSDASYQARRFTVNYAFREWNPEILDKDSSSISADSEIAEYLAKSTVEQEIDTILSEEASASIMASRWALMHELAQSVLRLQTKLQGARMELGQAAEIEHRLLPEVYGSKRLPGQVTSAKKNVTSSAVELNTLGLAASRCAVITPDSMPEYASASEDDLFFGAWITDTYGMQANDADTFGVNLIW
jgi:hypothetical protein